MTTTGKKTTAASKTQSYPPEFALHRYFIWADRMRLHFETLLKKSKSTKRQGITDTVEQLYISYWYAGLYVVIEGWQKLGLRDKAVDALLNKKDYIGLLKRYRNGVFHYQKHYFDRRFLDVWSQTGEFITWVKSLHRGFSRYFLKWHKNYDKIKPKE